MKKLQLKKNNNSEIKFKPVHYYNIDESLKNTIKNFTKNDLKFVMDEISKFYKNANIHCKCYVKKN